MEPLSQKIKVTDAMSLPRHLRRSIGKKNGIRIPGITAPAKSKKQTKKGAIINKILDGMK